MNKAPPQEEAKYGIFVERRKAFFFQRKQLFITLDLRNCRHNLKDKCFSRPIEDKIKMSPRS